MAEEFCCNVIPRVNVFSLKYISNMTAVEKKHIHQCDSNVEMLDQCMPMILGIGLLLLYLLFSQIHHFKEVIPWESNVMVSISSQKK